jgi:hypothetical protein
MFRNPDKAPDQLDSAPVINPDTLNPYLRKLKRHNRYFVQIERDPVDTKIAERITQKLQSKQALTDEEKALIQTEINSNEIHPDFTVIRQICKGIFVPLN